MLVCPASRIQWLKSNGEQLVHIFSLRESFGEIKMNIFVGIADDGLSPRQAKRSEREREEKKNNGGEWREKQMKEGDRRKKNGGDQL